MADLASLSRKLLKLSLTTDGLLSSWPMVNTRRLRMLQGTPLSYRRSRCKPESSNWKRNFAPARQTPTPVCSTQPCRGRSSAKLYTQMDMIVQLKQMNVHLMAQQAHLLTQLAAANQLVTSVWALLTVHTVYAKLGETRNTEA